MLVICIVIIVSLRLGYVIGNKIKIKLYKELITLCFIIYFMCLFYIVTFQDVSWSGSNLIPFREMFRYKFGSAPFIKNILGNVLLFMPYGVAIGYYTRTKKIRYSLLLGLILSLSIETTQFLIGRVFDVDDIILNLVGTVLGFSLCAAFLDIRDKLPNVLKKEWIYNTIILLFILLIIFYLLHIFGVIVW
jgi:glycopeptide antibiotics resistance protein